MAGLRLILRINTRAFKRAWKRAPRRLRGAMVAGLRRAAEMVQKEAMLRLTRQGSVAFGNLRASMGYKIDAKKMVAEIGPGIAGRSSAGQTGDPVNYGYFVEYGRGAGGAPPARILRLWVQRKMGVGGKDVNRVAYLVARKIGERGIQPRPFLYPALAQNRAKILAQFRASVGKEARRINLRKR